jgi:hypothetical protein
MFNRSKQINSLLVFALIFASGCATTDTYNQSKSGAVKSITIVGFDQPGPVKVKVNQLSAGGAKMAAQLALGIFGSAAVAGAAEKIEANRTATFNERLGTSVPDPEKILISALEREFRSNGFTTAVTRGLSYSGFEKKFPALSMPASSDLILEITFYSAIATTDDTFYPAIEVGYSLKDKTAQTTHASGTVAITNGQRLPSALSEITGVVPISVNPRFVVTGNFESAVMGNAELLREGIESEISRAAKEIASRIK